MENLILKKKIDEITTVSESEVVSEIGLLTGIGGQILTCSELFLHKKIPESWLSHLHQVLEKKIQNEDFMPTHCTGLAGIGWLYEYLSQRKITDYDTNILLEDFDIYLEKALKKILKKGNYDFLHGGVGIALYLTKRVAKRKELAIVLNQFLKDLEKASTENAGTIKWRSYLSEEIGWGYDIALAHGISGIVALLSKLYKVEEIDKEKTKKNLYGTVQYILAQEIDKDKYGSYFPVFALESMTTIYKSRMGWCYGDLGIASALYMAGKTLQEDTWTSKAMEILLYAAIHRKTLEDNFVKDAGLCHGAAGIGHIFYRMWWNTKIPEFKNAADYWFDITLKMARFTDGLAGFKSLEMPDGKPNWLNKFGFLEGVTGIGMALLTYYYEMEPEWDECLLLS